MKTGTGVALSHLICPICGNKCFEVVIINSTEGEEYANEVRNLHSKSIGVANICCTECKKYKDDHIFVIGVDENLNRTGDVCIIPIQSNIINESDSEVIQTLADGARCCFINYNDGLELGLWKSQDSNVSDQTGKEYSMQQEEQ